MATSKIYQVSDEEFKKIIANSYTYSDCLRALGLGTKGGSSTDVLKRRIQELNCSIEHFTRKGQKGSASRYAKYSIEEILVENSTYTNISKLKQRLINETSIAYKCAICGIDSWLNQSLCLHLDHINGINNDNRIENLRFLCPNCHSQTSTYAGKNNKHH